jgi:hypothetical protein
MAEITSLQEKEERKARFQQIGPPGFLTEWSRLFCCSFGFSGFSDEAELLHQA